MRKLKLTDYAKEMQIHYITAFRWFKAGKIPHRTVQTPSGSIYVFLDEEKDTMLSGDNKEVYIYARVSGSKQKDDLNRQVERLVNFSTSNGYIIKDIVKEIGSGLNQNRKGLLKLLKNKDVKIIVVEHKDRFSRFGFNIFNELLESYNRKIIVVNETDNDLDIVQDFVDVVTCMCARIYGQRGAKNKVDKMTNIINEIEE